MKLKVEGLEFAYNGAPVLKDVTLNLKDGEILGIIGPNASGKTTLLECINRTLEPQVGCTLINGEETKNMRKKEIAKKIGYVPQIIEGGFPTTVFNMILMGRKPRSGWRPSSKDLEIASGIMGTLGIEDIAMKDVDKISGGQRQKVLIARALAQDPEVLLLDEPTSSLDLRHQLEVLNIVKKQTENGISVVMAMHDLNLAARYSDKIVMLNEGEIFAAGREEVLTPENIELVYGVKVSIENKDGYLRIVPEEPVE